VSISSGVTGQGRERLDFLKARSRRFRHRSLLHTSVSLGPL